MLTNVTSMLALETIRGVNRNAESTQSEIATGKRVSSARDQSAVWAVSSTMSADIASYRSVSESLTLAAATLATARTASEKIVAVVEDMKSLVILASQESTDLAKIQQAVDEKYALVRSYYESAQFNGVNLLDDSRTDNDLRILTSLERDIDGNFTAGYMWVRNMDFASVTDDSGNIRVTGKRGLYSFTSESGLGLAWHFSQGTDAGGQPRWLGRIDAGLDKSIQAATHFAAKQTQVEALSEFTSSLIDAMKTGVGAITDADMETASAKMRALEIQRQLSLDSLSMINQAPQALLQLLN